MDPINNLKPEVREPVRKNNEEKVNREKCRTNWIKFGHEFGQTLGDGEGGREAWHVAVHGVGKSWSWLGDWKTTKIESILKNSYTSGKTNSKLQSVRWGKYLWSCLDYILILNLWGSSWGLLDCCVLLWEFQEHV